MDQLTGYTSFSLDKQDLASDGPIEAVSLLDNKMEGAAHEASLPCRAVLPDRVCAAGANRRAGAIGARYAVDSRRVFATGMSNGGMLAHWLACEAADVFRAVGGRHRRHHALQPVASRLRAPHPCP
jgi:dienelactone hydrolase